VSTKAVKATKPVASIKKAAPSKTVSGAQKAVALKDHAAKVTAAAKPAKTTAAASASKKTAAPAKGAATKAVPAASKVSAQKENAKAVAAKPTASTSTTAAAPVKTQQKPAQSKLSSAAANKKIVKASGRKPSQLENNVVRALTEIENTSSDLKADLRQLHFVSAKEISVSKDGKRAIVIFVPYRLLQQYHKIQARLVRELEKKFSGKQVVIIAQRRILPKPNRNNHIKVQQRPRSRTLTAVHDAILEDLVYPTEIVGKRLRYKIDGSRLFKILLDRKDKANIEHKLHTFATVYKRLTGKDAQFTFPLVQEAPSFAFKA